MATTQPVMPRAFPSSHDIVGPLLIGLALSCTIFGILTQQSITYYQRYFLDRLQYKILVAILWITQAVHIAFVGHSTYHYIVSHYGDIFYIITSTLAWSIIYQVLVTAVSSTIVKTVFMLRVWNFSKKNIWITGGIGVLIVAQAVLSIAYVVQARIVKTFIRIHETRLIATLSLTTGVVTDFVIAAALCFFLRKLRTGFKRSDSLVNMLCIYAINTGLLTSAVSATTLILYNFWPDAMFFTGSYFLLGNLYAISFITTLNTRAVIRGRGADDEEPASGDVRKVYMIPTSKGQTRQGSGTAQEATREDDKSVAIDVKRDIFTEIEMGEMEEGKAPESPNTPSSPSVPIDGRPHGEQGIGRGGQWGQDWRAY